MIYLRWLLQSVLLLCLLLIFLLIFIQLSIFEADQTDRSITAPAGLNSADCTVVYRCNTKRLPVFCVENIDEDLVMKGGRLIKCLKLSQF